MFNTHAKQPSNSEEQLPLAERMWTVEDVAGYFCVNPETVRNMVRRGELPAYKFGKFWRFDPDEIKTNLKKIAKG